MCSPLLDLRSVSLCLRRPDSYGFNLKKTLISFFSGSKKQDSKFSLLRDITHSFFEGDRVALIGPNGSGKTTFIRLLCGIYNPSSGQLYGKKYYPMIDRSLLVSHDLTAEHAIIAHYNHFKVHFSSLAKNTSFDDYRNSVIEMSGLQHSLDKQIKFFSEGMRTRLVFSLFISNPPTSNLAIDEGFSTGDKNFTDKANVALRQYLSGAGSLVFASHDDSLLTEFCSTGLVFTQGAIVFKGDISEALSYYHNNL